MPIESMPIEPRRNWKKDVAISGMEFGKVLLDAGVLPPNVSRFIIDVPVSGVVTIYYSTFPNGEQCEVILDALLDILLKAEKGK